MMLCDETTDAVVAASAAGWDTVATAYADRVEPLTSQFVPPLLRLAPPITRGTRVLDVGCGAGALALAAAASGAAVTATDASSAMLAALRHRAEAASLGQEITLALADGEALPAEFGGAFDARLLLLLVVVCNVAP